MTRWRDGIGAATQIEMRRCCREWPEGFFRAAGQTCDRRRPAPPVDDAEVARTEAAGARYGLHVVQWNA